MSASKEFSFKEGPGIFSPKGLIELRRPGAGVANQAGDLVLVPVSEYSFNDKKNKKSLIVAPIESSAKPLEIQLEKGGEAFWIQSRTIAHVVEGEVGLEIYALDVALETSSQNTSVLTATNVPVLIAKLPNKSATNFRYSIESRVLLFSDYVYPDGNLTSVAEQDDAYEARGNSAYVYDATYERHWDTWVGPKRSSLFSVPLYQDPDRKWVFEGQFTNLLQGTKHVRLRFDISPTDFILNTFSQSCPVEPFGGTDDFYVSHDLVVYTTLDPQLNNAWHTKQNIYIVDIKGNNKPRELTSGKQGATHSPVLNSQGTKVAWLELDEDGYESDRAKIVIYDLEMDVRFTLTQDWDRSPDSLAFSKEGNSIFFTAGDEAKVKVFMLPIPPTPSESTTHPTLPKKYTLPVALTDSKAASGIQPLLYGRLLFSQSSFTSPNDVFIIRNLQVLEASILQSEESVRFNGNVEQLTYLTESALQDTNLDPGKSFWFKGALDKDVQGWVLKPLGWKAGETKKWPAVLLIHGGPQGAWEDQWSTRWNPNGKREVFAVRLRNNLIFESSVFAQQGYFVILINPTGSTTFGQGIKYAPNVNVIRLPSSIEFTDAIAEDWGGKPFVDLQRGWKYVLEEYPEIDADRAVAAGASWGGYAIKCDVLRIYEWRRLTLVYSWIQGHPEYGFGFKALVFDSNYNGYSTDELFFFNHEWGGRPWEEKSEALSKKYSPSNFVNNWTTPQLLIHGSKDYRLPETESIGAFHALQQRGIRSRLVIFPDENHWVLKHGNSLKWHYEVFRWFDEFVGKD
ncbi:hypothetical protein C0993_006510 [Termitomyces sp. T159_Od127]|nr:hypothetical protein C0993_006510 [Termitomyces sp. T159_Od127]